MKWKPYDPTWLVALAKERYPDEEWLVEALSKCTRCMLESKAYIYFVSPERPNQDRSEWQIVTNVGLYSRKEGLLILDILTDQRVGGVEFINNIMDARMLGPVRPNVQRRA